LNMEPEITLPESVRKRAEIPILHMLELSKTAAGPVRRSGPTREVAATNGQ
jgi:hypothetical protein